MNYSDMTARELRKLAPSLGLHGASRMTKSEILAALADGIEQPKADRVTTIAPALRAWDSVRSRVVFDRERAAALRRTPVTVYAPDEGMDPDARKSRAALPRRERRHRVINVRLRDGGIGQISRNIPRAQRKAGAMKPYVKAAA